MDNQNSKSRQGHHSTNYISQTSKRLGQVVQYIKINWVDRIHGKRRSLDSQKINDHRNIKFHALGRNKHKDDRIQMLLTQNHYYYDNNNNQQHEKLKIVNEFLMQVQTNLEQIQVNLQAIYKKIEQYSNISKKQKDNMPTTKNLNKKVSLALEERRQQNQQHFQHIFVFILNLFFAESFSDIVNRHPKRLAIYLLQIQTKLSTLPNLIDSAYTFETDITTYEPKGPKYEHVWKKIKIVQMDSLRDKISNQVSLLKRMMKVTTSAVVTQNYILEIQLLRKVIFGLSFPYFLMANEESQLRCYRIWRNPKIQSLNQVWNLPEKGAISQCKKLMFASIKTSFFIYIPEYNQQVERQNSMNVTDSYAPDIFNIPSNPQQFVRTLVLYSGTFNFHQLFKHFQPLNLFTCWNVAQQCDLETIMIHFHGGGFVSLSSQTSQSYTRKWANQLKIPIFSVDYRKAPKYRFPIPLQDCFAAYQFIVERIHKYFNVRPKNIILAGDSAGGNLAVSLYALLLLKKYPILPTGMFLAYPAVDLRVRYSPSRLNSFDDPILIPPLLFLCLRQYIGQNTLTEHNPLASPILLSQYFIQTHETFAGNGCNLGQELRKWPRGWAKTTIMVGKKDPLYDDSLRLMQRMTEGGTDAKLIIYNELSHAFLSLDNIVTVCSRVLDDSVVELRELINQC